MRENDVAKEIVDAAYKIHTGLGAGLLESVYEAVMAYELGKRGLRFERQKPIPVVYEG
ncbi:MAG: GxxExxY protein, partial [Waterburya sp.]